MVLSRGRSTQNDAAPAKPASDDVDVDRKGGGKNLTGSRRQHSTTFPGKASAETKNQISAPKMFPGRREARLVNGGAPPKPFFNVVRPTAESPMDNDVLIERWKRRQRNARNSGIR